MWRWQSLPLRSRPGPDDMLHGSQDFHIIAKRLNRADISRVHCNPIFKGLANHFEASEPTTWTSPLGQTLQLVMLEQRLRERERQESHRLPIKVWSSVCAGPPNPRVVATACVANIPQSDFGQRTTSPNCRNDAAINLTGALVRWANVLRTPNVQNVRASGQAGLSMTSESTCSIGNRDAPRGRIALAASASSADCGLNVVSCAGPMAKRPCQTPEAVGEKPKSPTRGATGPRQPSKR